MVPGAGANNARTSASGSVTTPWMVTPSRCRALDADQRVDPVTQRTTQSLERRGALHVPAVDDQPRRFVVELVGLDEVSHALGGHARHGTRGQAHPRVAPEAARLFREREG